MKNNPKDPWAWAGLVGDTLDLLPFVTGAGEITKAFKAVDKVADSSLDVIEMNNKLDKIKDAASNLPKGDNWVYYSFDERGLIEYVGITNDFKRRENQWSGIRDIEKYCSGLDRDAARFVEQAVIDTFGRKYNDTGILNNIRNSIGNKKNLYKGYIKFFNDIWQ